MWCRYIDNEKIRTSEDTKTENKNSIMFELGSMPLYKLDPKRPKDKKLISELWPLGQEV